jgi:hypothetical protein
MYLSLFFLLLTLWGIGHPWNALLYFSLSILRQSVGLLGRGISPSQGRYLTKTQNKRTQTSMPWVGFEPTVPVFERAKTVHALDRSGTVIASSTYTLSKTSLTWRHTFSMLPYWRKPPMRSTRYPDIRYGASGSRRMLKLKCTNSLIMAYRCTSLSDDGLKDVLDRV